MTSAQVCSSPGSQGNPNQQVTWWGSSTEPQPLLFHGSHLPRGVSGSESQAHRRHLSALSQAPNSTFHFVLADELKQIFPQPGNCPHSFAVNSPSWDAQALLVHNMKIKIHRMTWSHKAGCCKANTPLVHYSPTNLGLVLFIPISLKKPRDQCWSKLGLELGPKILSITLDSDNYSPGHEPCASTAMPYCPRTYYYRRCIYVWKLLTWGPTTHTNIQLVVRDVHPQDVWKSWTVSDWSAFKHLWVAWDFC